MLKKRIGAIALALTVAATSLPVTNASATTADALAGNLVAAADTSIIDKAPPMPSITRYLNSAWDSNWFRSGNNLQIGDCIYTLDMDPSPSDNKSDYTNGLKVDDYRLTELPDKFVGCDYIITRVDGSNPNKDLHFYLEQECEIYAAISSKQGDLPGVLNDQGFKKTDGQIKIKNGATFWLAKKDAKAGLNYINKNYGKQGDYAAFYMILPKNGKAVSRVLSENKTEIVKEGTKPAKNAADQKYQYYINDVYNFEKSENVPTGYTGNNVTLSKLSGEATREVSYSANDNIAKDKPYTGNDKRGESPVDGDDQTYYESTSCPDKLTIDLQAASKINKIVMKVRNRNTWADRTQTIEIQTSTDGSNYKTLVAKKDYVFKYNQGVEVTFPETTAKYVRISCDSNTGADGMQMAEVEVYGPAQKVTLVNSDIDLNRYLNIASGGTLTKTLDKAIDGKIVYEGKVKSSAKNTKMSIPVMKSEDGKTAVELTFGADGYIKAGNTNVIAYEPNTWYVIKMLIDVDARSYEVWVDHMRKAQNVPFTDKTANNIKTLNWTSGNATMNFDNLRLYDNPEVYVIQDKFNGEVTDTAVPENWNISDPSKSAIKNVPFATDKSLQLQSTGSRVEASRKFGALTGDVTIEVKVRPMEEGWVSMPIIRDSKGNTVLKVAAYQNSFYISNGNNWEYVNSQEFANNYYPAGSWFNIKIVLNTYSNRYDFYIDGAKRYSQASFVTDADDVASVAIAAEQSNVVYLDNIQVYDSASLARGLMPKDNVFNVKDFGAKGDGKTDDTAAIDAAFKAAEYTGGTVLLENGTFYCGQITMLSDMTLFIDTSAKIFSKMDRKEYVHFWPTYNGVVGYNGNHQLGAGVVRSVEGSDNFRITGGGTLDCNGFYDYNQNDPATAKSRPCAMYLTSSDDFYVENINIINSPHWTLVPYESTRMTFRNVAITNHCAPNRDGIDPTNCSNITIENCHIIAGDDAICPKSGNAFPSINVDVRNVSMQSYCNGIKFGTDSYDDFKNYTFEDCLIKNVGMSGITLQAVDGSEIENIAFKRIDMMDVDNSIAFMVGNRQRANSGLPKHLGHIKGVVIEDMSFVDAMEPPFAHKNENEHASMFVALDPSKHNDGQDAHIISDVYLKNVYMEMPGGYTNVPSTSGGINGGYPEHDGCGNPTGWANTIRWAKDIVFENCQNVLMTKDVRTEYDYKDYYSGENLDNGVEGKIKYGIVFEKNGKALENPVLSGVIGVGDTSTVLNYSLIQALKDNNGLTIDHDTYDGAIVKCDSKGNLLLYNASGTKVLAEPRMEKFSNEDGQRYVFHIGANVDEASIAKKALDAALETAKAYEGKSGLYTADSWEKFSDAYDAAKKANNNTSANDRQKLLSDLITAIESLARPFGVKIEAESGELTGGAMVNDAPACSDGKQAGFLGGVSKGRTKFRVNAPEAAYYVISSVYCQNDTRQLNVEVNGVGYGVTCTNTGGYDKPTTTPEEVVVYLNKGMNEIALTGVGTAYAPNVDYITVTQVGDIASEELVAAKAALETAKAAAKAIIDAGQQNYTDESWNTLVTTYNNAVNVAADADAATLNAIASALNNAKDKLEVKETEQKPTETEQKPTETEQKPTETEQKPTETEQKPSESESETETPPTSINPLPPESESESNQKPTETEQKPTESQKPSESNGPGQNIVLTPEETQFVNKLGVSKETAQKISALAAQQNISQDTLLVTDASIKALKNDKDVKGSSFALFQAKAAKQTTKSIKLKWNKLANADGYAIYGNKCGNKYEYLGEVKGKTSYTQKNLKKGTYYKYIVRAYKVVDGTKVTIAASKTIHTVTKGGKYGVATKVTVKKSNVKLNRGKSFKLNAKEVNKNQKIKKHRSLKYESTNTKVAKVSSKGKITAKGKGTCQVYVYAQNGVYKKVKVTVK